MGQPAHALEMVGVTKRFDDVVAVDNATFSVNEGEFFSLLGPSGCGKTTTLRIVAGFEEPTAGELYLNGVEATDIPPFHRDTNLVFQNYGAVPAYVGVRQRGIRPGASQGPQGRGCQARHGDPGDGSDGPSRRSAA